MCRGVKAPTPQDVVFKKERARALTDDEIERINSMLAKDQRVELIPTKDGVRVIEIKREEVKKLNI